MCEVSRARRAIAWTPPARVAAGFNSGTYDKGSGDWTVTDHNAHEWVEVWFRGWGWVPFDPTPGSGGLSGAYSSSSKAFDAAAAAVVLAGKNGLKQFESRRPELGLPGDPLHPLHLSADAPFRGRPVRKAAPHGFGTPGIVELLLLLGPVAELEEFLLGHHLRVEAHVLDAPPECGYLIVAPEVHVLAGERGQMASIGLPRDRHDHLPRHIAAQDEHVRAVELRGADELLEADVRPVHVRREEDRQLAAPVSLSQHAPRRRSSSARSPRATRCCDNPTTLGS